MTPNPPMQPSAGAVPVKHGLLRVVSNAQLMQQEQAALAAEQQTDQAVVMSQLASHIRSRMQEMRNFRNTEGIGERLLDALRTYKGKYSAQKLQEIQRFGGSTVYARVTATKCRGATALLRDVFLGPERPWDIEPTPDPKVPGNIDKAINDLVNIEIATLRQSGQPIDEQQISDRVAMLRQAAEKAAKKQAKEEAVRAGDRLDDYLIEGGFYEAFAEFLIDLPIFPFACIKGPVVRKTQQLTWVNGKAEMQSIPKMFWYRVSPFDLYWSPGAAHVYEAEFIERIRLSRTDLLACRGLPGYDNAAIDEVLGQFYNSGFRDWFDTLDTQRAELEDRERWPRTSINLLDTAEYSGSVSGQVLRNWGMSEQDVPDVLQEYVATAWLIDKWVIKCQINPTPRQRHPYYISSFEKVPGALIGYGLPDLLEDIQDISNAAARALVNNLSIASGPQVVVNDEVLAPGTDDDLYPWKRWHVRFDPMVSGAAKPIDFFQPMSNSQELMAVQEKYSLHADEISAIPRYMTGNERVGGAGRTASGLAMLMGNAAKTLQNVAATIDRDILRPLLDQLYDMVMLTTEGVFRGDENIVVKGVNYAVKREQDRMRQLEFLQITANPLDSQIVGMPGRATVLRSVASNLGLDHENVVPDDKTLQQMQQQAMAQQQAMMQQQALGQQQADEQRNADKRKPEPGRGGAEEVRRPVEQEFTGPTGRPGMRMGG